MRIEKRMGERLELLTARPDGMPIQTYHSLRTKENRMIKERLQRGFLVYVSGYIYEDKVAVADPNSEKRYKITRFPPFVGSARLLKPV
jgi:hypothetical protein